MIKGSLTGGKLSNLSVRFSLQAAQQKRPHRRANPATKVFRTAAPEEEKKKGAEVGTDRVQTLPVFVGL